MTRAGEFPLVSVRTQLLEDAAKSGTIQADLEIQFAGQTAYYKQVLFQKTVDGNDIHMSGTIPRTLSDFKIDPPSFADHPDQERNARVCRYDLAETEMRRRCADLYSYLLLRVFGEFPVGTT